MKAYSPETKKGRVVAGHDVHHKTADCPKASAKASAKRMRHAARQDGKLSIIDELNKQTDGSKK